MGQRHRPRYSPVALTPNDKSNLFLGTSTDDKGTDDPTDDETVSTLYYPNAANNDDGNYYVNALRAYFHVALNGGTGEGGGEFVRAFVLNFGDGEETGIVDVDADLKSASHESGISNPLQRAWYTLDGRRLNGKPTKAGIYVNDGHKVVIK